ncbi:MAG: pimeloyl-ACP methyl ester carboxylesterase [Candidatus Azotimanducaceae bacterium]|jgi:pimeloyl-ACP methyl ester carboxylesterase
MRLLLLLILLPISALAANLTQHSVLVDEHPMAVWSKTIAIPKATVLLLHGRTYSSLPDFDLQVEGEDLSLMDALNRLGYDVYALDGRGYGKTPRDASGWLTPNRHVQDVIAVTKWLNKRSLEKVHIYAWSNGSRAAQLAAQLEPTLMSSITLIGYPISPNKPNYPSTYPVKPPAKKNTQQHAASDFIIEGSISQRAIDAYVRASLLADPFKVDFKNLHEWSALDATKVTTPTLLIQGEFDPIAHTSVHADVFTKLDTAKKWWIVLEGGDHAALLENTRHEMLAAMDAFMSSIISKH